MLLPRYRAGLRPVTAQSLGFLCRQFLALDCATQFENRQGLILGITRYIVNRHQRSAMMDSLHIVSSSFCRDTVVQKNFGYAFMLRTYLTDGPSERSGRHQRTAPRH